MSARKVAVWAGVFGAFALVLFVVGSVFDEAVAKAFYLGKNASDENVLGVEGLLWGEWIYDLLKVEFNCLPRLCALSETGWSPKGAKDFAKFTKHWQANRRILDLVDANWACDKLVKGGFIFKKLVQALSNVSYVLCPSLILTAWLTTMPISLLGYCMVMILIKA